MKSSSSNLPFLVLLAVLVLAVPAVRAQSQIHGTPDSTVAAVPAAQATAALAQPPAAKHPDAFGGHEQYTYIHASRFLPWANQVLPDYVSGTGYLAPHDDGSNYSPSYWVQVQLPNGAIIDDIYANVYDNSPNADWKMDVTLYEHDGSPAFSWLSSTTTSGTAGYQWLSDNFSPNPVFREWADMDGNGFNGDLALTVNLLPQGTYTEVFDLQFGGVSVGWHRTISPAPATATFGDVPTGHWAFQFVEALADSGITAGCGGGNYCPDSPITRAEMAIYLASALGLHWPT